MCYAAYIRGNASNALIHTDQVVSGESAVIADAHEKRGTIHANHVDMAKFSTRDDAGYKKVLYAIEILLEGLTKNEQVPSEDPTREHKPVVRSCPSPTNIFTGRKDILLQLHECFTSSPTSVELTKQRRFVLYGIGGGGKTQIALKFVKECQVETLPQRYVFNADPYVGCSS
jgi:hypothetical protein